MRLVTQGQHRRGGLVFDAPFEQQLIGQAHQQATEAVFQGANEARASAFADAFIGEQ
ncbi:hypothetical protein D3C86_2114770 [compost metagenome]